MNQYNIKLENLSFYAFHGCMSEENKIGGQYSIDLDITISSTKCFYTDSINHTVNYAQINEIISKIMKKEKKIIESVANDIVDKILSTFSIVKKVNIIFSKLNPPISNKADKVSVIITKEK